MAYAKSFPRWTLLRAAALLILLLLPAAVAQDPDERGKLAAAIRARVHAIEAARKGHLADRALLQQKLERMDAAVAALAAQRERSVEEVGELQQRLALARTELQQHRARSEKELAAVHSWARAARPVALRLAERIRAGIPHQRDVRAEAFEEAAVLLGAESENRGQQEAEGLQRFFTAVAQEMQLAATREVKSETVALDAELSKHSYVARFGLVNEVFVTEDGTHAGIASRDAASPWRVMRDPDDVAAITAVLDCVRKRRPPELVAVPFALGREQ